MTQIPYELAPARGDELLREAAERRRAIVASGSAPPGRTRTRTARRRVSLRRGRARLAAGG